MKRVHWLLTASLLIGFPVVNGIYWWKVLKSGALPPDGDSIAIPIFLSFLLALILTPFVVALSWFALRRSRRTTRLWVWREDRLVWSVVATMLCGLPAAACALLLVRDFVLAYPWNEYPWYEYLWSIFGLMLLMWFLTLRAALIDKVETPPGRAGRTCCARRPPSRSASSTSEPAQLHAAR